MKIKPYASYQNTDIEWLKEIPSEWSISKVKHCFIRKNEKANQEDPIVLSLARDGVKVRDITTGEGQIADSYFHYNPVKPGDLLLNPMDLVSGANCSLSEVEGVISPAYINLKAKKDINPKYYDYFFKLQYWSMALFAHGKGVSFENRWTINNETLMNYFIPVPDKNTQDSIVNFLEKKLHKINSIIENDKKFIGLLEEKKVALINQVVTKGLDPNIPMKDSGIEWIGEIPEHWDFIPVDKFSSLITDYVSNGSFASLKNNVQYLDEEDYAILVRLVDNTNNFLGHFVYINEDSYNFLSKTKLYEGDIILSNIGATLGTIFKVPDLGKPMSLGPNVLLLRFDNPINGDYFFNLINSDIGQCFIDSITTQTTQPKFNKTEFR